MTATNTVSAARPFRRARGHTAGGFNLTALRLEITRVLRNRRTLFSFSYFPAYSFLSLALAIKGARAAGDIAMGYVMISMAVYGAMVVRLQAVRRLRLNGVWVGAVNFVSPRSIR